MAGGHSLIPLMKFRLATPGVIVDIGRLSDLSYVRESGGHVAIGALTHPFGNLETSQVLKAQAPMLAHVASKVGDPAVRHKGTLGGSIAHADPASDLPAALLGIRGVGDRQGTERGTRDRRRRLVHRVPGDVSGSDELMTEIRIPNAANAGWSYQKFQRRAQDWAIVAVAAVVPKNNDPAKVALVNMGSTPMTSAAVESALASGASIDDAAAAAADGTTPPSDLNGDAEYRSHLARVLTKRALTEAS